MEIRVFQSELIQLTLPALLVLAYEEEERFDPQILSLDKSLGGELSRLVKSGEITGKFKEFCVVRLSSGSLSCLIVVGVGKRVKFSLDKLRSAAAKGCRLARRLKLKELGVPAGSFLPFDHEKGATALAEGALLGLYRFRKYKSEKSAVTEEGLERLALIVPEKPELKPVEHGVGRGKIFADATNLVRDLVNEPSNAMTPALFAKAAEDVARKCKLDLKILEKNEIQALGMEAFLSVAKGSQEPPKLLVFEYRGGKKGSFTLGLVGKGVTFDSGGISIKPSEDMHHMTDDMAGAAACLGALQAISQLQLPLNVIVVLPLAENLPDGNAYKPGDIVTSYSGKTIEIINTDAEGRLLLADALAYTAKMQVDAIVDIATLTGGVRIALGGVISGVFSTDKKLLNELMEAAEACDEPLWELPLLEEYSLQVKGSLADLKNSAGRFGAPCTAAAFLKEFVGDASWAHIDIAATARIEGDKTLYSAHPYLPKSGATGIGTRLLAHFAERLSHQKLPREG